MPTIGISIGIGIGIREEKRKVPLCTMTWWILKSKSPLYNRKVLYVNRKMSFKSAGE